MINQIKSNLRKEVKISLIGKRGVKLSGEIVMSISARREYFLVIREKYYQARDKKEKTRLLDEYCENTGQARKYVIRRMHQDAKLPLGRKKIRQSVYAGEVTATLIRV